MPAQISAVKITKSFGARVLFKDLSISLASGEKIGVLGPNGVGKSTLVKLLARVDEPDEGSIVWSSGQKIQYVQQQPVFKPTDSLFTVFSDVLNGDDYNQQINLTVWSDEIGLSLENADTVLVSALSGGQQKKVALLKALISEPDFLILDEPTNHLDVESILWLEDHLASQKNMGLLVVTHDRLFLQKVSNQILDIDPKYRGGYLRSEGGYAAYLESREIQLEGQKSQESARANDFRRELLWLRRGAQGRQTKQKARQDMIGELGEEVKELRKINADRRIQLEITTQGRAPKKLIEATDLSHSYGDKLLFKNLSLVIENKSRIAFLGRNGSGKTTLIKDLLGLSQPSTGSVKPSDRLTFSYFDQNKIGFDPKDTLQTAICPEGDYVHLGGQPIFIKSYLDRFKFRREQHDLPVTKLSGGELARLWIAKMMLNSANLLVLDEPTNDLDFQSLETLREALAEFDGAVLLITHDRFFMEQVCDTIIAFPVRENHDGTLIRFASYLQWEEWFRQEKNSKEQSPTATKVVKVDAPPNSDSNKNKKDLLRTEKMIQEKEQKMSELQAQLASPAISSDSKKLAELSLEIQKQEKGLEELLSKWESLQK